jgi:hypothetical protein
MPILSEILNMLVTDSGSTSLSCAPPAHDRRGPTARRGGSTHTGTFFCTTNTAQSVPRTPMAVRPWDRAALKAYSAAGQRDLVSDGRRGARRAR